MAVEIIDLKEINNFFQKHWSLYSQEGQALIPLQRSFYFKVMEIIKDPNVDNK